MVNSSGFDSNTNPQTTDWEEHGAAGDVSTGRRLKYTQLVPLKYRQDVGATYEYHGFAAPGIATATAAWRVMRVTIASQAIDWAEGNDKFLHVWDNRASLNYS